MNTLLEIVQRATAELGLQQPTVVTSSTDQQIIQLYALANREVRELANAHPWTALQTEYVINVGTPTTLTGTITNGSAVITGLSDTSGLAANTYAVSGQYIQQAARIASVDSPTQVTMTETATGGGTESIVFSLDTFPVPTDFNFYLNRTMWDRSRRWELRGPESPQSDEWVRSGIVATGPRRRWRQIGKRPSVFRIWPPPSSSDTPATLAFEYISTMPVEAADGSYKVEFTADTDTTVFDPYLVVLGVKWRFLETKGFDFALKAQEYINYRDRCMARDGGLGTLDMSRRKWPIFISPANVPDTGFGVP